jgi:hypothetical protein
MALQSPGVEVTVIDESFYTPAAPGTTSLIVLATGQNKSNASATNIATYTTAATAGKVFKITSQKELSDYYGTPYFEATSSAAVHGGERNEYGLLAAYSILEVSNSVFIVRADVDLDQLEGKATAPGALPSDGSWWVDTKTSVWGVHEWNGSSLSVSGGQTFKVKTPIVLDDATASNVDADGKPKAIGAIGEYAVVFQTVNGSGSYLSAHENATLWYKSAGNGEYGLSDSYPGGGTPVAAGTWVQVGSQAWSASFPAVKSASRAIIGSLSTKTIIINDITITVPATLDLLVKAINDANIKGVTARAVNSGLYLYTDGANDSSLGDSSLSNAVVIAAGTGTASEISAQLGMAVDSYYGPALQQTPHTIVPEWKLTDTATASDLPTGKRPSGSVWIKTSAVNSGARLRVKRYDSATTSWVAHDAPMYASSASALYGLDRTLGGINIPVNALYTQVNAKENSGWDTTPQTADFRLWRRAAAGNTLITSEVMTATSIGSGNVTFTIAETAIGVQAIKPAKTITFTATNTLQDVVTLVDHINNAGFEYVQATFTAENKVQIFHKAGGDFRLTDLSGVNGVPGIAIIGRLFTVFDIGTGLGTSNFYELPITVGGYVASNWQPLAVKNFAAADSEPLTDPEDQQLWYNNEVKEVDIMVHNGKTWVGYRSETAPYYDASRTTIAPVVAASNPYTTQTKTGDLWVSTADTENFPTIYRYNSNLGGGAASEKWEKVDVTDQETETGILFADARYGDSGVTGNTEASIETLLLSNYLDPDAPDPALYPKGMLLWNLRRSGGNVKRFHKNHFTVGGDNPRYDKDITPLGQTWLSGESMELYDLDRWVTASVNHEDGSGTFGRKAQRSVVVQALSAAIQNSDELRDQERRNFNLIATPGYPEVMMEMVNLNIERGLTSFIVGDVPLRLPADATSLTSWATNEKTVLNNGDAGMVTYDEYLAVFYPVGYTTNRDGASVVVPSSHMMLKTITLSDNVSYPWFAPAGTRRGGITNASSVGYIDASSGEFQTVALNEGQRDTLYDAKVNPITFFTGVGHVNFGQKTRAKNASALDRINVARLVVYLRTQLNRLARPYIFEPNDQVTRNEIKQACESLLIELVGLRAISDYIVVCDSSNNTPSRVDRNELWVDIAIVPIKAAEFIYIPLRVKNTGAL